MVINSPVREGIDLLARVPVGAAAAFVLAACVTEFSEPAPRGGWRETAERACMDRRMPASGIEEATAIVEGDCGMDYPLQVAAFVDGQTTLDPLATLGCPLTEALDTWLRESVQPAAMAHIGSPVVEIRQLSAYACRKRNNFGLGYSEHAFGNALDIGGFTFASGRRITIAKNWRGPPDAQAFFREIYATACQRFTTVIGPGSNIMHYNHIHVDLAEVAPDNSPRMCKPPPEVVPPERVPVEGELVATVPRVAPTDAGADADPPAVQPPAGAADTATPGAD
jgi:hypothetical protein